MSVADRDGSHKAWAPMPEEELLQVRTSVVMVSVETRRRIIIINIMPHQLGEFIP